MKPNIFIKGDTIKWSDKAKQAMPLSTHDKEMKVLEVNDNNILAEGEKGFVNHEWFVNASAKFVGLTPTEFTNEVERWWNKLTDGQKRDYENITFIDEVFGDNSLSYKDIERMYNKHILKLD